MREISGILADTKELRELIMKHPDYPIAVMCSEDVSCGDYSWTYAPDITCRVAEILDCDQPVKDGYVYNSKIEFEEDLEEHLWETELFPAASEEYAKKRLAEEIAKYEPYWKKCICIYADV